MNKKQRKELIEFVERFASGRWTELADGTIEISGNFDCYNNQLTSLPESIGQMKVGGDFYCSYNQLTSPKPQLSEFDEFEVGNDYIYAVSKCGGWSKYHRKFQNLTTDAKRKALELMQTGIEPGKAIRTAKRAI